MREFKRFGFFYALYGISKDVKPAASPYLITVVWLKPLLHIVAHSWLAWHGFTNISFEILTLKCLNRQQVLHKFKDPQFKSLKSLADIYN